MIAQFKEENKAFPPRPPGEGEISRFYLTFCYLPPVPSVSSRSSTASVLDAVSCTRMVTVQP